MTSFRRQAKRFAGRGAPNLAAPTGIGLLAATAAGAPGYAQQQATPILVNGTQVTISGKYGPITTGPNTNCAAFARECDRDICMNR